MPHSVGGCLCLLKLFYQEHYVILCSIKRKPIPPNFNFTWRKMKEKSKNKLNILSKPHFRINGSKLLTKKCVLFTFNIRKPRDFFIPILYRFYVKQNSANPDKTMIQKKWNLVLRTKIHRFDQKVWKKQKNSKSGPNGLFTN